MQTNSLTKNIVYKEDKPNVEILFETPFSKEIRILMKEAQVMKEHKTPFPIVVEIFQGEIQFFVEQELHSLKAGDILSLKGGVPHTLKALSDSIIRLTLSKYDELERVKEVASL